MRKKQLCAECLFFGIVLIFEQSSFDLLQNILKEAGELPAWTPYEDLVTTTFAAEASESAH